MPISSYIQKLREVRSPALLAPAAFAAFMCASEARATPVLTLEAYVVNPANNSIVAADTEVIPFDTVISVTLPKNFGAYTTIVNNKKVNHVGFSSGTFGGSGTSGQPSLEVQGHVQVGGYTNATAPGELFVAITEQNVPGSGTAAFNFEDSGLFSKAGSKASYFAYYDMGNHLFPQGNLVSPVLPYVHISTNLIKAFDDPAATSSAVISSPLVSFSEGFLLQPASGSSLLVDGVLDVNIPEPPAILLLGFGGLLAGAIVRRSKRTPRV